MNTLNKATLESIRRFALCVIIGAILFSVVTLLVLAWLESPWIGGFCTIVIGVFALPIVAGDI